MTASPPDSVPCVCGAGAAERKPIPVTEPSRASPGKRTAYHHYKHRGCPFGGTIVVDGGAEHRRIGPVFEPERFGVGNVPAAREALSGD